MDKEHVLLVEPEIDACEIDQTAQEESCGATSRREKATWETMSDFANSPLPRIVLHPAGL